MANKMYQNNKPMLALFILGSVLLMQGAAATVFKVGGNNGWSVPNDNNTVSFSQWAEKHRFQIGDSLLFVYPSDKDSVLHVTQDDYTKCNTASPIETFKDGNTQFKFSKSGDHFFISGNNNNCLKNEKMHVVVMAYRGPPPSPVSSETPPSPPPSGSTDTVPSPAPVGEESPSPPTPPPSGASTIFLSAIGSLGAFIGSYLLLVL